MLLQNNCKNNDVSNGLKQKERKKTCKTVLYSKIKERRETGGEWLIGAHTQNCNNATQEKTKVRKALIDES